MLQLLQQAGDMLVFLGIVRFERPKFGELPCDARGRVTEEPLAHPPGRFEAQIVRHCVAANEHVLKQLIAESMVAQRRERHDVSGSLVTREKQPANLAERRSPPSPHDLCVADESVISEQLSAELDPERGRHRER